MQHGFDVIDVHHHLETGSGIGHSGFADIQPQPNERRRTVSEIEVTTRLATMDARGVGGAVIIGGHTYLRPRGVADTEIVNDAVAAYCASCPDRFVAGVGIVEPLYGSVADAEVKRCADDLGLVGISFHNQMQGVPIDSPLMHHLMERIGEAGLVPFLHALGNALENLWQVDMLATAFPDLTMIVLDVFHDPCQVRSLADIADRHLNLHFDLSLSPGFELFGLPQVRAVGAHRFLYGTDMYSWPLQTRPFGSLLSEVLDCDLTDADKQAILAGNARRLLRLEAPTMGADGAA